MFKTKSLVAWTALVVVLAGCSSRAEEVLTDEGYSTGFDENGNFVGGEESATEEASPTPETEGYQPGDPIEVAFPIRSPKGYQATLSFSGAAPTVELGDPGMVTVSAPSSASLTLTNETEDGREVNFGYHEGFTVNMMWSVPDDLVEYTTVTEDNCTDCDTSQLFFRSQTVGRLSGGQIRAVLAGYDTFKFEAIPTATVYSDVNGTASLMSMRKTIQIPEEKSEQLAEALSGEPDLVVFDVGGLEFADGIENVLCTVGAGDWGGPDVIVGGVAMADGRLLGSEEAAETPGNKCHDPGSEPGWGN